ncbi:hypothetical protein CRV00_06900 [Malaciobacter molluscorum]|uniref:CBASS cGAMP-activated phospholipase n=1 Tax=Malaciobacter molluscorum TaxID=1032072 RepID=UPI00100A8AD9|nr:CBASS cGAMP-activated phospholipase [Malaciobacter molluscorum]RXJ94650.1 hypothetical protein CRV00_06900 [Malaciobacter molluscorum]
MKTLINDEIKVLSLDGGGVRGYLSALILRNIEEYLNNENNEDKNIGQRFDLIVGTSTGGVIALALASGKSAKEIVDFYDKHMYKIFNKCFIEFSEKWYIPDCIIKIINTILSSKDLFFPTYSNENLKIAGEELFGDLTLEDVKTEVCITSVNLNDAKPRLHKSKYFNRNVNRLKEKLVDIALFSSAAPTFFKAHSGKFSEKLIDGGICANNPSMIAITDAIQILKQKKSSEKNKDLLSKVVMLSIGTGEQGHIPYKSKDLENAGKINWAKPISEILMSSQSSLIEYQTKFLLSSENYLRINPLIKESMKLDDVEKINNLKNLADITSEVEAFLNKKIK